MGLLGRRSCGRKHRLRRDHGFPLLDSHAPTRPNNACAHSVTPELRIKLGEYPDELGERSQSPRLSVQSYHNRISEIRNGQFTNSVKVNSPFPKAVHITSCRPRGTAVSLVNKAEPLMLGYGLLVSCYSCYPSRGTDETPAHAEPNPPPGSS